MTCYRTVVPALCCFFALSISAIAQSGGGTKVITNHTSATVSLTLFVRSGSDPAGQAGTTSVDVNAGQSVTVHYGNATDIYLNGYSLNAGAGGDVYSQHQMVTKRSSSLDNQLNTNSAFDIYFIENAFNINAHN